MSSANGRKRIRPGIPAALVRPVQDELVRCRDDPARYNETILCRSPYWSRQKEVCKSVVRYSITAVKAGNGVGKSRVGSGIGAWFPICRPFSRTVILAPTKGQLENVLWAELRGAADNAARHGHYLGGRWDELRWELGDGWSVEGWGQGSVESQSGRHAGDLLAIIDEASGVNPRAFEAVKSLNPSHWLLLGNPLRPEGEFYDYCEGPQRDHINVITIPSLESPHIHLRRSPWGMADANWLEQCRADYGEDSLWWKCHVLAQFPDETSNALLPSAWLHIASQALAVRAGPVRLGIDIALGRGGDDSQLVARDDNGILGAWASNRWNLDTLAARVKRIVTELGIEGSHVVYDATGVGADFGNRLQALGILGSKGYMGEHSGGVKYGNLRSAAHWLLRRRLDPNKPVRTNPGTGPGIFVRQQPFHVPQTLLQRYRAELQGLRYELDPTTGRICMETKDVFVKRLKHSPNFVDALAMTFAYPNS
jgi:hypothetical protein